MTRRKAAPVTGPGAKLGRGASGAEVMGLEAGLDFRDPRFRREVFHRFYEFHLRYRTHPGCVYFLMPYLANLHSWGVEQRLWFAYINGNTQNPLTSWLIFRKHPELPASNAAYNRLGAWFAREYERLEFDTDRRHWKKEFLVAVDNYRGLVREAGGTQEGLFDALGERGPTSPPVKVFEALWSNLGKRLYGFGRLSLFSYLEYLRIMGYPVECTTLFLEDIPGSRSHRNGLAKVLGRDDLDWHDSNPAFDGAYAEETLWWLEGESALLLGEAATRAAGKPYAGDVGFFTLESALCTYKSWHRPNRRYPNVYADMLVLRIRRAERLWAERFADFWDARRASLPRALRLEDNPADPGLAPEKQNHYLTTGRCVMMGHVWPEMWSAFDENVREKQGGNPPGSLGKGPGGEAGEGRFTVEGTVGEPGVSSGREERV